MSSINKMLDIIFILRLLQLQLPELSKPGTDKYSKLCDVGMHQTQHTHVSQTLFLGHARSILCNLTIEVIFVNNQCVFE